MTEVNFKMWSAGAIVLGVQLVVILFFRVRRSLARSKRLPPGTMGWPLIGETLQFRGQHPNDFFSTKQKRYGEIVKSHFMGCPSVLLASAEAVKLVLVTHGSVFKPTYPISMELAMGRQAIFFQHGTNHQHLRHVIQAFFTPEVLRGIAGRIEELVLEVLDSIEGRDICTFAEVKKFTFDVGFILTCGSYEGVDKDEVKRAYHLLEEAFNALHINFPGTAFYKGMKARKQLSTTVAKLIADRRATGVPSQDILGALMKENFSHEQIVDNVIGIIFAAQDTTASVLTWMIKYLAMNPSLLADVSAEQEAIRSTKGSDLEGLAWADMKHMPLTSRVLQETMRLATVISFTFREATEDVEYGGYVIPKGWKVLPLFRNLHHNPEYFPDPYEFDPSRFEQSLQPNVFLPFGSGIHSCLGSDLARYEILTFVHHLVTKYRWELLEPKSGLDYRPFPVPKDGLPLHISRK